MKKLISISDEEYRRLCLDDGVISDNIDEFNTFLLEKDTGNLIAFSNMPDDVDTPIEHYLIVDDKE